MKVKQLTIVMAGGGSGGHVYPIKSLIQHLNSHKDLSMHVKQLLRFGQKGKIEEKEFLSLHVQKNVDCRFVSIMSGKLRRQRDRRAILKNIGDLFKLVGGIFQSAFLLKKYKVDVIFCKGGYIAAPVVIAGAILRIKIVAHDSDTHPGLASRIATPFAKKVFAGFDNVFSKAETIGQILSDDIIFDPEELKKESSTLLQTPFIEKVSKLDKKKTVVLVLGGSLGSKDLYDTMEEILLENNELSKNFVFIIVGGFINKDISKKFEKYENVLSFDYLSQKEMGMACYYADLGITRGGTTSLAEQKLYNMKLLIIPIPHTHDQFDNAKYYVDHYSDILIDQNKNLNEQLTLSLEHFQYFKKTRSEADITAKIHEAKRIIREELLTPKK